MSSEAFQILCTGDVHLGRRPSRVPVENDKLSVRRVWDRFVETALNREVDAAVLTGDIVDSENQMYEAYGALERGIQDLVEGGVEVVAAAGNHDYSAFPRLARSIDVDGFHLLGQGGTWDEVQLHGPDGEEAARFVGWSFPQATEHASPLGDLEIPETDSPTVGVLHCEVGSGEGQYAPVQRDALARAPIDAWLLGHIHGPGEHREAGQLQLYPGSLQPLDPGEPGVHGAWLIEVAPEEITAEKLPLASLRYKEFALDVTDLDAEEEIEAEVLQSLREDLAGLSDRWPELSHVAYRLLFEGRTNLHREIEETVGQMIRSLQPDVDGTTATIEAFELETHPDYDLQELAQSDDPPGVLAQLLLRLGNGDTDDTRVRALLRRASKATAKIRESSRYEPLRHDSETREPPGRETLRSMLYKQGLLLLDELYKDWS
jgi:DNA repair exonuclease SbcCD nuclease subunit